MISLDLCRRHDRPLQILCLGAHADDIEIGCGGTLLNLLQRYPDARLRWGVFSAGTVRRVEARRSAAAFLAGTRDYAIDVFDHRDGFLPYDAAAVKESMIQLRERFTPDVIFTHRREDRHQDHRLIAELTWNLFRNHLVLEYEIAKWDGDLKTPQIYVPLTTEMAERKIALLVENFPSQRDHDWFEPENFRALMRLRGLECRASAGYAEAFFAPKTILWGS